MALRDYKVNEAIEVTYQAAGATTGLTVTMEIYDETGVKDAVNFPDVTMTEIGTSGRYKGSFTPDAAGEWHVQISDSGGGKAVKQFSVGQHNVDSVGGLIGTVDGKVDAIDAQLDTVETKVDGLQSPPMVG